MADGQVYLVGVLEGCYKIGRSGDSEKRLLSYSPKLPVTLTIHHRITTDNPVGVEQYLHAAFSHRRSNGEWFRLTSEDVERVKSIISLRNSQSPPEWLSQLVGEHFPSGIPALPLIDPPAPEPPTVAAQPPSPPTVQTSPAKAMFPTDKSFEVEALRADGKKELVLALSPDDFPSYHLFQIEHGVVAEIDGVEILKHLKWRGGKPVLISIYGDRPCDVVHFRDGVKVVAFVRKWLDDSWLDDIDEQFEPRPRPAGTPLHSNG